MDKSSYLFMSKRKKLKFSFREMDKNSTTDSNISLDSLESHIQRKSSLKGISDENVDTILVPFYEKDVLIKVPKDKKRKQNNSGNKYQVNEKLKKELFPSTGYLVNKDRERKTKQTSYLEMFRKQFAPNHVDQKKNMYEIRSISPEFGDTERESIGEDANNPIPEFYNTEPYNEIYYKKLISRDLQRYLDNSFEEDREEELHLEFTERFTSKPVEINDPSPENLRSVSEVTNSRRHTRRATAEPIQSVRLGGLGPDVEQIKPRLERARSLQRYSEKVRMENRLKIYKKTCQTQIATSGNQGKEPGNEPTNKERQEEERPSYLVNKSTKEKNSKVKNPYLKSKSADVEKTRARNAEKEQRQKLSASKKKDNVNLKTVPKQKVEIKPDVKLQSKKSKERTKSSSQSKGINTESGTGVPPVQISFMVNVGGVRQTSALKTLEEKHKLYQEQVKAFMDDNNNM